MNGCECVFTVPRNVTEAAYILARIAASKYMNINKVVY